MYLYLKYTSFQTVDNVDIRDINVAYLRQQMGLVSQEPVLFDYSIEGEYLLCAILYCCSALWVDSTEIVTEMVTQTCIKYSSIIILFELQVIFKNY